jgi:hypothetical protein
MPRGIGQSGWPRSRSPGCACGAERFYQQLDLLSECRKHPAVKLRRQIPAIGPIRAAMLVALLQTPHRFRTKRQLWAYSGFAVETHDSGEYRYVQGKLRRNTVAPYSIARVCVPRPPIEKASGMVSLANPTASPRLLIRRPKASVPPRNVGSSRSPHPSWRSRSWRRTCEPPRMPVTDYSAVIRPGRKDKEWLPENLLTKRRSHAGPGFQSANYVFPLARMGK